MDPADAKPTDAPTPVDGSSLDGPSNIALTNLQTRLDALQAEHDSLAAVLAESQPSSFSLKDAATRIPVLDGHVSTLATKVDAVSVGDDSDLRARRKALVHDVQALSEIVQLLPAALTARAAAVADRHKVAGNEKYKAQQYDEAIRCYTEAISIDRRNPTFFCNRSACFAAKAQTKPRASEAASQLEQLAIADAQEAAGLDVNAPKAYLFQVRPLLRLEKVQEAARVLQGAPLSLRRSHAEIIALSASVQEACKGAGNAAFKAQQHERAVELYTLAIDLESQEGQPSAAVFYSNRSAVYQARRLWDKAASDAQQCVRLDPCFVKGHLHLSKVRLQQGRHAEAKEAVQRGLQTLQEAGQNASCAPLQELLQTILTQTPRPTSAADTGAWAGACSTRDVGASYAAEGAREGASPRRSAGAEAGGSSGSSASSAGGSAGGAASSGSARAAALKEQGNGMYKAGNYAEALRLYSQAIGTEPSNGALYGNRAACWMMLEKYERAVSDCSEGLRHEAGAELGKVRARQATALTRLGKLERAADILQQGVAKGGEHAPPLRTQLLAVQSLQASLSVGRASLEEGSFSKAKRSLLEVLSGGVSDEPQTRLLLARAHLALHEHVEAAREAQRALALDADHLDAYVLRADALVAMGLTDKAMKLLREALQRDPDNEAAATKLKKIKRAVQDLARIKEGICAAFSSRQFEAAAALCGEGLRLELDDKAANAHFHSERAKAFQLLGRSRARGETRREREDAAKAKAGGAAEPAGLRELAAGEAAPPEDEGDPRAGAPACWKRCLQEASKAIYLEPTLLQPYLLKAESLQALERWKEALTAMEQCINSEPSRRNDQSVLQKVAEAQFLVRKSEREDLYALLGVKGVGSKASEKEIRGAYKRAALEWHPDKHADKGEEAKKAAEAKFKQLGDALEILTDEFKRKLWDEGHDKESIEQQVQMRQQQQQGRH